MSVRPRVVVTPGDYLGIGPELAIRLWLEFGDAADFELSLVGPPELWKRAAELVGGAPDELPIVPVDPDADPDWGHLPGIGEIATAVRGCLDGRFDALCTGPLHKADLIAEGFPYMGHTPYLAALCGAPQEQAVMVFSGGRLTVSLATLHVPLAEVPGAWTEESIARAARGAAEVVRKARGIQRPRIALAGLNPHAGEGGRLGAEDQSVVAAALQLLAVEELSASGPYPGDTVFARALAGHFDAVVAAYHDQGLVAVKTLDAGRSVNITAGLPLLRTSVDHGTARDIAWQGRARPEGMFSAARMAAQLARSSMTGRQRSRSLERGALSDRGAGLAS